MKAERMILRAKHLKERKGLEALLKKVMAENTELMVLVSELRAALEKHTDSTKLVRPATLQESAKILVSK